MDPKKVSSTFEWPALTNIKQFKSFQGLANYHCRFIPGFVAITHPLDSLLKKNKKFLLVLKLPLIKLNLNFFSAPVLAYPNRELP